MVQPALAGAGFSPADLPTETSDPKLKGQVRRFGIFNARGCFNCGSCTITCDLASDVDPFPRRTMQSVVLGLKDTVNQSLDPWLCHDCGDCSLTCPRDTRPRESLKTLRRYLTVRYDWTGLSRVILRSPGWEIAAFSIAAALVLALIVLYHLYIERLEICSSAPPPWGSSRCLTGSRISRWRFFCWLRFSWFLMWHACSSTQERFWEFC